MSEHSDESGSGRTRHQLGQPVSQLDGVQVVECPFKQTGGGLWTSIDPGLVSVADHPLAGGGRYSTRTIQSAAAFLATSSASLSRSARASSLPRRTTESTFRVFLMSSRGFAFNRTRFAVFLSSTVPWWSSSPRKRAAFLVEVCKTCRGERPH